MGAEGRAWAASPKRRDDAGTGARGSRTASRLAQARGPSTGEVVLEASGEALGWRPVMCCGNQGPGKPVAAAEPAGCATGNRARAGLGARVGAGEEDSRSWLRRARLRPDRSAGRPVEAREALRRPGNANRLARPGGWAWTPRVTPLTASSTVRRCYGRVAVRRSGFQILLPRTSLHEGGRD